MAVYMNTQNMILQGTSTSAAQSMALSHIVLTYARMSCHSNRNNSENVNGTGKGEYQEHGDRAKPYLEQSLFSTFLKTVALTS